MSEFGELVSKLLREQADEEKLAQAPPQLIEAQARLRAQLKSEGDSLIARLKEIGASTDFRAIGQVQRLDLSRLMASGISSDIVGTLDSQLRQFLGLYHGTLNSLEGSIPHRIAALRVEDVQPGPGKNPAPTFADWIAREIKVAAENVAEVERRLEGLKRLVEKLAQSPRRTTEMWTPERPAKDRGPHGPAMQVTG